jgi:hypothetical protein
MTIELREIRSILRKLAKDVLEGSVSPGKAAVANQVFGTLRGYYTVYMEAEKHETLVAELREVQELARSTQAAVGGDNRWGI